jgi:hypothetical protein
VPARRVMPQPHRIRLNSNRLSRRRRLWVRLVVQQLERVLLEQLEGAGRRPLQRLSYSAGSTSPSTVSLAWPGHATHQRLIVGVYRQLSVADDVLVSLPFRSCDLVQAAVSSAIGTGSPSPTGPRPKARTSGSFNRRPAGEPRC